MIPRALTCWIVLLSTSALRAQEQDKSRSDSQEREGSGSLLNIGSLLRHLSSDAAKLVHPDPKRQEPKPEEKKDQPEQEKEYVIHGGAQDEEKPVGPYLQPEWTTQRRSPVTRIYLQVPPGAVEFEQWFEFRSPKNDNNQVRMSEEFEFGLGYRFQLDLYLNTIYVAKGSDTTIAIRSFASELRWAFADWGKIWGNPTIYLEYIQWNNQPDAQGDGATSSIEPKLLLGDEIAPRWHWGVNIFYEHTLGNKDSAVAPEMGATGSLSYTLFDQFLSIGAAVQFVYEVDLASGEVVSRTRELYVGPSIQLRLAPYEQMMETVDKGTKTTAKVKRTKAHLDLEPVWGVTSESLNFKFFIVFGWDF